MECLILDLKMPNNDDDERQVSAESARYAGTIIIFIYNEIILKGDTMSRI